MLQPVKDRPQAEPPAAAPAGTGTNALDGLSPEARARLDARLPLRRACGAVPFPPDAAAKGFPTVLSGRIGVFSDRAPGCEILLCAVRPGQSSGQATPGLLGDKKHSGAARAALDCTVVMIPRPVFPAPIDAAAPFRACVFIALARRRRGMMPLAERVVFPHAESRHAATLLALAAQGAVTAAQADLATRIGSARAVVSRLDHFALQGQVAAERDRVLLTDSAALRRAAVADGAVRQGHRLRRLQGVY